jgi:hypothetical protein
VSDWVRLKPGNDWGNVYFALEPLTEHGMAQFSRGIKVKDGDVARVRWDDGSTGHADIVLVRNTQMVGDMGHNYEVTSRIPHVKASVHGHEVLIPIDEVDVSEAWARSMGAQ